MGNQSSSHLPGDKEPGDGEDNILHFEHSFEARLVDESANLCAIPSPRHINVADTALGPGKVVRITLVEEKIRVDDGHVILGRPKPTPVLSTTFAEVTEVCWDHSHSSVKIVIAGEGGARGGGSTKSKAPPLEGASSANQYIFVLANSLELEQEMKLRLQVLKKIIKNKKSIPFQYIGMFAGPTKPKPFQRKRANLSKLKPGSLPSLNVMKEVAMKQYQGAAVPVQAVLSRRLDIALQHIHEGHVTFQVVRATHTTTQEHSGIVIDYEAVKYAHDLTLPLQGGANDQRDVVIPFQAIAEWEVVDLQMIGSADNGLRIKAYEDKIYFFQIRHATDIKHVFEFLWNSMLLAEGEDPLPGSTHGRIVEEMYTVTGAIPRPLIPVGNLRITDGAGRLVCDLNPGKEGGVRRNSIGTASPTSGAGGGGHHSRKSSISNVLSGAASVATGGGVGGGPNSARRGSLSSKPTPMERSIIKAYWHRVVMHQGWLLKKGGMSKKWLKRYFVLYRTCMGHILGYYSDYTETALYSDAPAERNVIDCCKVEFIRPVSNTPDTPPYAFDIQSIQRDWTVCAADQADLQSWLKIISYAVDADVGILPDDETNFLVKPRHDPTMKLYLDEYSTYLRIHAWGVSVDIAEGETRHRVFLWPYTDLYKWSILSQKGKMALQLTVFTTSDYHKKTDFIFRTRDAQKIASVIEYFIEKFMCVMHLRLELDLSEPASSRDNSSEITSPTAKSQGGAGPPRRESSAGSHSPPLPRPPSSSSSHENLPIAIAVPVAQARPRRASGQHAASPPKSPMYRGHNEQWEEDEPPLEGAGADWASEEGDDDRQEDFLDLDNDVFDSAGPSSRMNSPTAGLAALSFGSGIGRGASYGSSGGVVSSPTNASSSGASIVAPSSPPPMVQYMPKGIESQMQAKMEGWATALTASGQGLLFENDILQILLRQEFHGHQGNLQLLYKNVGNLPLESFGATASSTTIGVMIQASAPAATRLAPGDQTSQSMRVVCMEPFTTGPSVVVEFTSSQPDLMPGIAAKYTYPIPLPIAILNFTFGLEMDRATFLSQWQSITVPEVMDTFQPPKSTVAAADAVGTLLTRSFHLKLVRELCQRNEQMQVLTLAGSLETGTLSPAGKQLRVGALVRLEQSFKASAYRLTVRAVHPTCAMAVFRAIKQQLLVL